MKTLPFWCLIGCAPLPFLFLLFHFLFGLQKLGDLEEEMHRIYARSLHVQAGQKKESALLASLQNPDPHYLEKHIESLSFLASETKKHETIQLEGGGDEFSQKRLQFLKEGGNRLVFSEEQIRTGDLFLEIEEKQQHPVEMNEEDLKRLLCLIEGTTIWPYGPKEGRPQLIIKDFKLSRKENGSHEKVFVVSMQLIRRENVEHAR